MPVFDWNNNAEWLAEVPKYAASFLTRKVEAHIAASKPDCWSDDFRWLPVRYGIDQFTVAFANHYERIRAFHGCRPTDLASYFLQGIRGQDASAINSQFLSIYSDLPESLLLEVIKEFKDRRENEAGKLWVVLAEHDLVELCGHYLIQGNEYLLALASSLSRYLPAVDYTRRLRSVGTPTVFELSIPTAIVPELHIHALARLVLAAWGDHMAGRKFHSSLSPCLTISRTISAQYIVSHSHPARIQDPHHAHITYSNRETRCVYCNEA